MQPNISRRGFLAGAAAAAAPALLARHGRAEEAIHGGPDAAKHRLSSIEWFVYDTGRTRPNYWRPGQLDRVYGLALRLRTDRGAEGGWADEVRIRTVKPGRGRLPVLQYSSVRDGVEEAVDLDIGAAQEQVAALWMGRAAGEIEGNWHRLNQYGVPLEIITMADLALWDLCGRIAGKPVYRLIGQKRDSVRGYVSSMPNLAGPEIWAAHAVACKKRGYGGYKIHPYLRFDPVRKQPIDEWRGFPDHDLAVCRAVRDAVGPDFPLMLDAAWCYTYEQAERVGQAIDELCFTWFESPMPENDAHLEAYARLAKAIRTPLCAPQAGDGAHYGRRRWIARGACKVCRADVYAPGGGITSCMILAGACTTAGIQMDLHAWGPPIYNLQAIAAIPESVAPYQELSDADPAASQAKAGHLVDRSQAAIKFSAYEPDAQGRVRFTDAVGLGMQVDWRFIAEHGWKS